MSQDLLQIKNLTAAYGPITALKDVSLTIKSNEIVTLIGANGAGKSTLLLSLFGQPRCKTGEIVFSGTNITQTPTHLVGNLGIALVPEGRRIFGKMAVEENLLMGAWKAPKALLDEGLTKVYDFFPKLKQRRLQRAGTMSGGEQQMLAIGRAMMSSPKLLLLDEPSLGLAPIIIQEIFHKLKEIAQSGTTIFLVEQNARKALQIAHRGYVLVNGEIKLAGSSSELMSNPRVQELYLGH